MHFAHTGQAHHVGNFVRVHKHCGGAMRNNSAAELCNRQHTAFDMHMGITQARNGKAPLRVNHLCIWPDQRVAGLTAISKAAVCNCNCAAFKHLA